MVKAAVEVPFPVLYPSLQTGQAEQQQVRAYPLKNQQNIRHHAYVVVFAQNATLGGYYDFEGTDWLNPPLFAHARTQVIGGRTYEFVDDGSHIHVVGWRVGQRPVLAQQHAARGTFQLADACDRQIGAAASLALRVEAISSRRQRSASTSIVGALRAAADRRRVSPW